MRTNFFFALAGIFLIQIVQGTSQTDIRCHSNGIYHENLNRCDCRDTNYTGIHCHIKRTACQKNECGKATSCDVVNNVATCTCVEPPTGYEWDAKCEILSLEVPALEGSLNASIKLLETDKYTVNFYFNANETCDNVVIGETYQNCSDIIFSSYKKNTTSGEVFDMVTSTIFSANSYITAMLNATLSYPDCLGMPNGCTDDYYKSIIDNGVYKMPVSGSVIQQYPGTLEEWNMTDIGMVNVNITLDLCDSKACDGHVAGCRLSPTNLPICTCKDGWEFSNGTLTNVCKEHVATACENNGNYYMNDNVVACDCNHLPEWQGEFCDTPTTDCGGLGAHGCMHDSKCEKKSNTTGITDHDNKYTCDCKPGFIGDKCQYNLYNWQTDFTAPYTENFTAIEAVTTSHFWVVFAGKGENQGDDFFFGSNSSNFDRNVSIEAKVCQPGGSCTTFYTGTHEDKNLENHGYYYFEIGVSNITHTELNKTSSVDETISIVVTVTDASPTAVSRRDIKTWEDFEEEQKNSTISPRFAIVAQIAQCETNTCSNRGECQLHYGTTPICVCEDGYEGIRCHLESQKDDSFPVWAIALIATLGGLGIIALLMYICKNMGKGGFVQMP